MKLFFRLRNTRPSGPTETPRPKGVIRRILVVMSACALMVGVTMVAIGAYRATRTSEGAASQHAIVRSGDEQGGIYDRPVFATATPIPTATAEPIVVAQPPPPPPPLRDIPYRLLIDKIGVNAPVGTYGLDSHQVPTVPTTGSEVAWYNFSSQPGTGSNAVFAAHVTWNGRAVFYRLDQLAAGDQITLVANGAGTKLTYTVTDVFLVDADDPHSVSVMAPTPGKDVATLITCGGRPFYVGGVAQYDYTHRLIVRAALTSVFTG